jgi:hypothetical protein|tara:strand:+ start:3463 stop:5574 length:2112 start_codon:yes stop_codon:yes gene_type:complete
MAITLRGVKGTALTHTELDNNFRSFYYSASMDGSSLTLFTTASGDTGTTLHFNNAAGNHYEIQFKSGSAPSGSNCNFSSSANLLFDYDQNHLKLTGSGYITGDLTVGGSVQAQTFHTEFVTSSIIYESGSNKFGDSADDRHSFTGSVRFLGPVTQSGNFTQVGDFLSTGSIAHSGSIVQSGSYTRVGNHESTGSLKNKGNITNVGQLTNTGVQSQIGNFNVNGLSTFTGGIIGSADISGSTFNNTGAVGASHITGSFTGSFTGANDGLTGLPVQTYTNGVDNRVLTSTGTDSINGESTLTYDGSTLKTTGNISASLFYAASGFDIEQADGRVSLTQTAIEMVNTSNTIAGGNSIGLFRFSGFDDNSAAVTGAELQVLAREAWEAGDVVVPADFVFKNRANATDASLRERLRIGELVAVSGSLTANDLSVSSSVKFPGLANNSNTGYKTVVINTSDGQLYYTGSYGGGGGGGATVNFPGTHRVVTAGAISSSLSGSTDLTWDGENLKLNNDTIISDISASAAHTDVKGLIKGNNIHTLVEGKTTGNVVIGLRGANTSSKFAVISGKGDYYSNDTYDHQAFFVDSSGSFMFNGTGQITGSLEVKGDVTAFYSSDERLKDNVTPILNPLEKVRSIGGYEFDWNDKSDHDGHDVGVIAQEIEKVLPEIVVERDSGYKAVRYEKITALLIEAIKQQQLEIDELKARLK